MLPGSLRGAKISSELSAKGQRQMMAGDGQYLAAAQASVTAIWRGTLDA